MATMHVRVEGLTEFIKALNALPSRWKSAERTFLWEAGREIMRDAGYRARTGDGIQRKSAADIKSGGPGVVVYGGQGYSMGAEFGSYRYHQFQTWRGNQDDAGYFLWPAVRSFRDMKILELWQRLVWKAVRPAFPH